MENLVTPAQVVSECINNINFDSALIKDSYITAAQYEFIKPFLGDDFYDALTAAPDSYTTLTGYLFPALKWYAFFKSLPVINIHLSDQGMMINSTDHGSQASSSQRAELAGMARSCGDTFLSEAKRYLDDNYEDYPLWVHEKKNRYLGGIIL